MTCVDKTVFLYLIVFIAICECQEKSEDYQVPTPTVEPVVEALWPKGFRVTLKDDGYSFFGFRGKINEEFNGLSEGDIKKDISGKPRSGKWVYKNRYAELKIGDTIFYWIYIIKNGKGHRYTDLEYTVTEFVKEDGMASSGQPGQILPSLPTPNESSTIDSDDLRYDSIAPNCTISETMVQGRSHICKGSLIFREEFNKTSLRELKEWDAMTQFPGEPDYPFNVYIPDNTVSFEEGSFVITPVLTASDRPEGYLYQTLDLEARCTGKADTPECKQEAFGAQILPPVTTAKITTRRSFRFRFGRVEVRAKLPSGSWLMPGKADTPECKQEAFGAQILPPVTTAKITTRRSFRFRFGRVEVRAKLPSGSWLMPEINLEASDNTYGPDYESGLKRIAFVRGNPGLAKKLYGGPVLTDSEPFRSTLLREKIGIDNWHKNFHIYTMIWRPNGIDLLVDGEQYGTVDPGGGFFETAMENNVGHASHWQKGTVMAPLDQMFHLTLGLRVGGVNDFDDDLVGKPWKNAASKAMLEFWNSKSSWHPSWYNSALMVDFVRVYAL